MRATGSAGSLALLQTVRRLFEPLHGGRQRLRVGLEAEAIPVRSADGRPVPPRDTGDEPGTLAVLEGLGQGRGWCQEETASGLPRFLLPEGGVLSYEPGGQLEFAGPPHTDLGALDRQLDAVWSEVGKALDGQGIRLLARGVDPVTPIEDVAMVLEGERYPRQQAHYDAVGPWGRVMMLQTAALHVNVDLGHRALGAWGAANALAPLLVALFANAPVRASAETPHRSHRAALWRRLDPARTAVFPRSPDPSPAYHAFALGAGAFLLGDPGEPVRPFRDWLGRGATLEDFRAHLTTLFPEVRPRGYLEVRSVDALPARWCVVPAALVMGLLHHSPTREKILEALPAPDQDVLERAGRLGLQDPLLGELAGWIQPLALEGLHGLGPEVAPPSVVARVEAFFDVCTSKGKDPGAGLGPWIES